MKKNKRKTKSEYLLKLRIVLYNHTRYQINAMIWYLEVFNMFASNLICILMNINEDIRNKTKNIEK